MTCAHKDIDALAESSCEQRSRSTAKGIEDYHSVAEPCEVTAFLAAKVEGEYADDADGAAQRLADGEFIALNGQRN